MPYIHPFLFSVLFAHHVSNWAQQSSVMGYFTQRSNYADPVPLHIAWFEPLFLVVAAFALVGLLMRQHSTPRALAFARCPPSLAAYAAITFAILVVADAVIIWRVSTLPSDSQMALGIGLSLGFKVLALVSIWSALRLSRNAQNMAVASVASRPDANRRVTFRTTVVLATAIHLLFPVREYLFSIVVLTLPGLVPSWFESFESTLPCLAVDILAALLIAHLFLLRGARDQVFLLRSDTFAVRIAFWFVVAFLVLAPVATILGAIPYGGGGIPKEVRTLFAVTQLLGLLTLYYGLVRGDV